ncbi:MAG: hypothetical protein DHS20C15_16610 [Planctomycetota bacterium]|nr:MAG: hypothetical protein DHS20C15_16610 [Planctomycetota bacterium]
MKVLLVEDDPAHAELILHALAHMPTMRAEVRWEMLFSKGLAALGSEDFDGVLLDLNLPGNSLKHTLQMPHLAAQRGVPLVAITSMADPETVKRCLENGALACLDKADLTPELLEARFAALVTLKG